jgi:hypothetical protein
MVVIPVTAPQVSFDIVPVNISIEENDKIST